MLRDLLFHNRKLKAWGVLFAVMGSLFWTATASMDLVVCCEPGESTWGFMAGSTCYKLGEEEPSSERNQETDSCKDFHLMSSDFGDQVHPGTMPSLPPLGIVDIAPRPVNAMGHALEAANAFTFENPNLKRLAMVVMRH